MRLNVYLFIYFVLFETPIVVFLRSETLAVATRVFEPKWVQSMELDIANGSFCNLCWLFSWRYIYSLHSADELQQERNSCPLLRSCFIGSCHVGVSKRFSRSISLAVFCLYTHFILADQISCRSYVGSVYPMQPLAVSYSEKNMAARSPRAGNFSRGFLSHLAWRTKRRRDYS